MNTPWQAVWLLAGEVAGVVAITFIIVWRLRSVVWQRTLWQASLLAICGVLLMEFAALNQAPNPRPKPESQPLLSLSVPAAVQPVVEFKTEERSASTLESAELAVAPLPVDESQPAPQEVQIEPVALTAKPGFETTPISREVATETEVKPIFPLALALAIGVWLIGVCVLAGRLLFGRALLLRFCSRSQLVADSALVKRVQGIALKLGLGEKIQVLETERIHTPVVFGLFQRGIALPKGFAQRFAREEQEAILAHELAHLSARDPLWYLLADTLVSLLWWHPLVWFARARLHVTSEMAADEACVLAENGPETLAQCLVSIAQEISPSGTLESIGIEGSGFRSRLGQRVERLLKLSAEMVSRPAAWRTRMVKIGMPVLLVGVMVISSGWMRRDEASALKELPGMTWATLRTAIEIPPENNAKRERVPQLAIKPVELAQNTQSIDQRDIASGSDQNPKVPVKIYKIVIQGEKKELNLATLRKLDEIIMPELFMDGLPLGPAVEYLMAESKKLDPEKIGLKITWEGNVPFSPNQDQKVLLDPLGNPIVPATALESQLDRPLEEVRILVNPELKKLNFGQVLDVICAAAGWPLKYRIQDGVIVITAKPKPIKGASPVRKSQSDIDKPKSQTNQVQVLQTSNPVFQTSSAKEKTPQRQRILQKLDQVVIKELFFDGRTLPEVVLFLREESEKKDPEKIGVNFIINSNLDDQPKGANALLGAATNKIGLEQMTVKVNPPLKNLTMAQALEVIVQVATPIDGYGLQVEVNDYAVVFRAELKKTPQMFTRAYKIDEKVFIKELESRVGDKVVLMATNSTVSGSTNALSGADVVTNSNRLTEKLQAMARMYFVEQGVNLSTNGAGRAATQIFYNDRTGKLLVRASLQDLEAVNQALEDLHAVLPLDERMPNDVAVSAQGNVSFGYFFEAGNYVRGLEKLTGKKLDELTVAALAGRPNAGKNPSVSDWRLAKWQQVDLLTEEFLSAQGVDISSGKFKLISSGGASEEEVRWVVKAGRAEREEFRKISEKIRIAGKQEGASTPADRTTKQEASKSEKADKQISANSTDALASKTAPVSEVIMLKKDVSILVQDAKQLYELGQLVEAEKKLQEAIKRDPVNSAAYYYLNLVQTARNGDAAKKKDSEQRSRIAQVENKRDVLPVPNPYVRTQAPPAPSKALLRIEERLDNTVLKELFFDKLPLAEVVLFLMEESIKQDPEKRGVNFIINSKLDNQPGIRGETNAVMPDLEKVIITINPPLKNLTMREALTAITNATARLGANSLAFSVNDYTVVFRQYIPEPPQMFVRRYKVDPDTFTKGLKKVAVNSGLTNITTSTNMQEMTREFFRHVGLQMTTNTANAAQILYNDTNGMLLIRATLQDLEVAQQAIEVLNMWHAQVQIEARYIEVTDKSAKEMGLTWFTSGPLNGTNTVKLDQLINVSIPTNQNVRLEAPVLPNHVSILSPSQAKAVIRKFTDQDGTDLLSAPKVTTVNNRQAMISVQEPLVVFVEKSKRTNELSNGKNSAKKEPAFITSPVTTGPMLDVLPKIMEDGLSLQLTWRVSIMEFVGYDKPGKGMEKDEPLPRFRVRQVTNTSMLRDGQTLLLGCGMAESNVRSRGPAGKLVRLDAHAEKKHVIVLLTARIVDPAGNPVNRDEELGY